MYNAAPAKKTGGKSRKRAGVSPALAAYLSAVNFRFPIHTQPERRFSPRHSHFSDFHFQQLVSHLLGVNLRTPRKQLPCRTPLTRKNNALEWYLGML